MHVWHAPHKFQSYFSCPNSLHRSDHPLLPAFSTLQTKHHFHIMPPPFLWFTVVHFSPSTFHACFITQLKPTHLNWKPRARDQIIESSLSPLPNGSPWPGEIGVHTGETQPRIQHPGTRSQQTDISCLSSRMLPKPAPIPCCSISWPLVSLCSLGSIGTPLRGHDKRPEFRNSSRSRRRVHIRKQSYWRSSMCLLLPTDDYAGPATRWKINVLDKFLLTFNSPRCFFPILQCIISFLNILPFELHRSLKEIDLAVCDSDLLYFEFCKLG